MPATNLAAIDISRGGLLQTGRFSFVLPGQRKTRIEVRLVGAAVFAGARVILLAGSPKIRETVKGFGRANQDSF
jgi:hypothetical protein